MANVEQTIAHPIGSEGEDVTISVEGGDGQALVSIQLTAPTGYWEGERISRNIGKGSALKGKSSFLTATVTDSNPLTDYVSLDIQLTNGSVHKTPSGQFGDGQSTISFSIQINHE